MTAVDLGTATVVSWPYGTTGQTVTLTVTLPDATTATPTVAEVGTSGTYSATVSTPQAGRYLLAFSKAAAPVAKYTDVLDVWPADPRFIVSLDEVVSALRVDYTQSPADISDQRLFIAAATPIIEDIVGAVIVRTVTQLASGGKSGVALYERASAITSVKVNGATLTANSDYVFASNLGIVYAGSASSPGVFLPGQVNIEIVYTVGSSTISQNVRLATIELVRHWWQYGRNANGPAAAVAAGVEMVQTPSGYWVPNAVFAMCKPQARADGIG